MFSPTNHYLSYSLNWFCFTVCIRLWRVSQQHFSVITPGWASIATTISLESQLPKKSELSNISTKTILWRLTFVFCRRV